MIARYEKSVLSGKSQVTVQRYGGLQNLPHWHMECELIFSEKGSAEVMTENTVYSLTEGGCVYIRSRQQIRRKLCWDSLRKMLPQPNLLRLREVFL